MLSVGDYIQSKSALVYCLSSASYNPETDSIEIDDKNLTPNVLLNIKKSMKNAVWHDGTKVGYIDVINNDPDRALSIWQITKVKTHANGCGTTNMAYYGQTTSWARHFYEAKRVTIEGIEHPSKETLSFSSSGHNIIKDLQRVSLPN